MFWFEFGGTRIGRKAVEDLAPAQIGIPTESSLALGKQNASTQLEFQPWKLTARYKHEFPGHFVLVPYLRIEPESQSQDLKRP